MRKNLSLLNEDLDETVELEYDVSDLDIDSDDSDVRGTVTIEKTVEDIAEYVLVSILENDSSIVVDENDDDAYYKYVDEHFDELFEKYENEIYKYFEDDARQKVYDNWSDYEYTEEDYWADYADDHYYDDDF